MGRTGYLPEAEPLTEEKGCLGRPRPGFGQRMARTARPSSPPDCRTWY